MLEHARRPFWKCYYSVRLAKSTSNYPFLPVTLADYTDLIVLMKILE